MTNPSFRAAARLGAMLLACSALQSVPAMAQQAAATNTAPQVVHFGTWGVDISTRDTSVRPGDDFQRYAAGKWLDTHEIPAEIFINVSCLILGVWTLAVSWRKLN